MGLPGVTGVFLGLCRLQANAFAVNQALFSKLVPHQLLPGNALLREAGIQAFSKGSDPSIRPGR